MHEASLHKENSFVTLTYAPEKIPPDWSIHVRELQLFFKKLRKVVPPFRYFFCGEYGEICKTCWRSRDECGKNGCRNFVKSLGRPHYHGLLFGLSFPDAYFWRSHNGHRLYRSPLLERVWGNGFVEIGEVTFESAAYVARYVTKKINGEEAKNWYEGKTPEFLVMSRGGRDGNLGGIGKTWFKRFKTDVFPSDSVVVKGKELRVPKFYDKLLELDNPEELEYIKSRRRLVGAKYREDNDSFRLRVKEAVKRAQLRTLKRDLEETQ